jgi:hypothetical protein
MVDDHAEPHRLDEATVALDRLALIGEPVVLAGEEVAGRRLPPTVEERIAWVRRALDRPEIEVAACAEPGAVRGSDTGEREAVGRWREIGDAWQAGRLVTSRPSSVGPARRAGLEVVRIGPRGGTTAAAIERPDHEARDLLHAVSLLLATDTFLDA